MVHQLGPLVGALPTAVLTGGTRHAEPLVGDRGLPDSQDMATRVSLRHLHQSTSSKDVSLCTARFNFGGSLYCTTSFSTCARGKVVPKLTGECLHESFAHRMDAGATVQVLQSSNGSTRDAAWDDMPEMVEVRGDVQSNSMRRDPLGDLDTDSAQLPPIHPHPGHAINLLTNYAKGRERVDHDTLQPAQVPVQILRVSREVDDWIRHQLAWAMVRHLPSPRGPVHRKRQLVLRRDDIRRCAPRAQRDHWIVLEEEERVGSVDSVPAPRREVAIERFHLLVESKLIRAEVSRVVING